MPDSDSESGGSMNSESPHDALAVTSNAVDNKNHSELKN